MLLLIILCKFLIAEYTFIRTNIIILSIWISVFYFLQYHDRIGKIADFHSKLMP